ncbi:MAG TPA: hypothetical protein VMP01_01760 [Pirellulaceae bacterium]|nr:hypothetical protein [Pirellulaceae bacterium]
MSGRTWTMAWPGLAGLWLRGGWTDLGLAVAFAAALNFALVTTFVWPQLISRDLPAWGVPLAAWVLVLWFWVMGRGRAVRLLALEAAKSLQPDDVSEALLRDAQSEYLKGHWLEARSLLVRLLSRRPGDVEARLLLVSVLRRSGEMDLAGQQLVELSRLPAARRWQEEMQQERRKLARPNAPKIRQRDDCDGPATISRAA